MLPRINSRGMNPRALNSRGLMFSLMVLVLILGVLLLNGYIAKSRNDTFNSENTISLTNLNEKISNVQSNIGNLPKSGKAKQAFERILPFNYSFDGNYLDINFSLPFESAKISNFFDSLNLYETFVEDKNFSNAYDGFDINLSTLKNQAWGGQSKNLQFVSLPSCMAIKNNDLNQIRFEDSNHNSCSQNFLMANVKRIDFNIALFDDDFNSIKCNAGICPQDSYLQGSANPYLNIYLETKNCPSCLLSQKIISKHFNPVSDFNFFLYCSGTNCKSKSITLIAGQKLYETATKAIITSIKFTFKEPIENLFFSDFNVLVSLDANSAKSKIKAANNPLQD